MDTTIQQTIAELIESFNSGDEEAREKLMQVASERLLALSRSLKRGFPGVGRWEQTEDVCQIATFKLYEALLDTKLNDGRHFFRLAAKKIRETLIDLARHYQGPQGMGANHRTVLPIQNDNSQAPPPQHEPGDFTANPAQLAKWQELHEKIESLAPELREMFDLLWYHELSQAEVADIVGISIRQVKRRWREAKLQLAQSYGGADVSIFGA